MKRSDENREVKSFRMVGRLLADESIRDLTEEELGVVSGGTTSCSSGGADDCDAEP